MNDLQDEAEMVVLQIDEPLKMSVSTSGTRKTRAIRKNSPGPQWMKGNESDETQVPHFEKTYVLDGTLREPIEYFRSFFTEEVWQLFVIQSNLYSTQRNVNKPLNTNESEFEQWLGLCIQFSVSKLPSRRMHWNTTIVIHREFIASVISRDRFLEIKANLHLVNNNENPNAEKLFKVHPLITHLRQNFRAFQWIKNYA